MKRNVRTPTEQGEELARYFRKAGFDVEGFSIPGPKYVLLINRIPSEEEREELRRNPSTRAADLSFVRVATIHVLKDGSLDVLHGLNFIKKVLARAGYEKEFG
ncbi:MAG TPA: hypothetical protein VMN04_12890 [Thermoanaerobaculia bacterium]|nr:hypothetical protein [Thermoanaerobaculia bacterium]